MHRYSLVWWNKTNVAVPFGVPLEPDHAQLLFAHRRRRGRLLPLQQRHAVFLRVRRIARRRPKQKEVENKCQTRRCRQMFPHLDRSIDGGRGLPIFNPINKSTKAGLGSLVDRVGDFRSMIKSLVKKLIIVL